MKNINYDLVKLLHIKLDVVWRLEKFYINDANQAKCHSLPALEKILEEEKAHVAAIKNEIEMRVKAGVFD